MTTLKVVRVAATIEEKHALFPELLIFDQRQP
jgi:hypothetical protein